MRWEGVRCSFQRCQHEDGRQSLDGSETWRRVDGDDGTSSMDWRISLSSPPTEMREGMEGRGSGWRSDDERRNPDKRMENPGIG